LDTFITNELPFPEGDLMSREVYDMMIKNIRTIIEAEFKNLFDEVYLLKEKN